MKIRFCVALVSLCWLICLGLEEATAQPEPLGPSPQVKLTISRIFADPPLSGAPIKGLKIAPDGSRVTYLKGSAEKYDRLDLWQFNIASEKHEILVESAKLITTEKISAEEQSRRERQRISDSGIVDYVWSKDSKLIAFTLSGRIYVADLAGGTKTNSDSIQPLSINSDGVTDLKFSPQGRYLSYVRADQVFVLDLKVVPAKEVQVTPSRKGLRFGVAEFVAQEEMDRDTGYWWSPDDSALAIAEVDESTVELMKRYEINGDGFDVIEQRYPRVGTPNARVRLGLFAPNGSGKGRWLELTEPKDKALDYYLARVDWTPDSQSVLAQVQSRDQKQLVLRIFSKNDSRGRILMTETAPHWVNLHQDLRFLKGASEFIWKSDRDGHAHLYRLNFQGEVVRQLTRGDWPVKEIVSIDETQRMVYFLAHRESYYDQRLYGVSFDGGPLVVLTPEAGTHNVTMADGAQWFIDDCSDAQNPSRVDVVSFTKEPSKVALKTVTTISDNRLKRGTPLFQFRDQIAKTEFGSIKSNRGYDLHYRLVKPRNFIVGKRYPLLLAVYGGPARPDVRNAWGDRRFLIYSVLANEGYLVLTVDNRGMGPRSRDFLTSIAGRLGSPEVEDQVEVVKHFLTKSLVDPKRIGSFGWSYGGYMTLMLLSKHPELFKAGVAVAPVSDWTLYDTHYTERYMGTPQSNSQGYKDSNVLTHIAGLRGSLLLVHGMADDNVLFTHSTMVLKALQERGQLFETMVYPGSKHGIYGRPLQTHVYSTILDFLKRRL